MGIANPLKNKKEDSVSCLLFHVCFIKRAYQVCDHFDYMHLWWLHANLTDLVIYFYRTNREAERFNTPLFI